ncbi:hypothetical protein M3J09_004901 [Ascochyta lentis]
MEISSTAGPYAPLDIDKKEARVLYLEPGLFHDDVRVRLQVVSLDDDPTYETLSYAWGTEQSPRSVLVNGTHYLTITQNLDCALRHLRYRSIYPRVLWIDALCINQQDLEERSHQVQLMSTVYTQAADVLKWLGPDKNKDFTRFLRYLTYQVTPKSPEELSPLLRDAVRLVELPWFYRVWVAQEFTLSTNEPKVYIGRRCVLWCTAALAIQRLLLLYFNSTFLGSEDLGATAQSYFRSIRRLRQFEKLRERSRRYLGDRLERLCRSKKQPLCSRLEATLHLQASDPRDKIYDILAISDSLESSIIPDYTLPIQTVLSQAAAAILRDGEAQLYLSFPLHFARCEDSRGFSIVPDRPSWVPDPTLWSKLSSQDHSGQGECWMPSIILHRTLEALPSVWKFSTSPPMASFSEDCTTLFATGRILGHVSWTSILDPSRGLHETRNLHEIYHTKVQQRGYTYEAFFDILMYPQPETHSAFDTFLRLPYPLTDETLAEYEEILTSVLQQTMYQTFYTTSSGKLGKSYHPDPDGIRAGDILVGLFGIDFPFLLRPLENKKYMMINVAYIVDHHCGKDLGLGEGLDSEDSRLEVFEIV